MDDTTKTSIDAVARLIERGNYRAAKQALLPILREGTHKEEAYKLLAAIYEQDGEYALARLTCPDPEALSAFEDRLHDTLERQRQRLPKLSRLIFAMTLLLSGGALVALALPSSVPLELLELWTEKEFPFFGAYGPFLLVGGGILSVVGLIMAVMWPWPRLAHRRRVAKGYPSPSFMEKAKVCASCGLRTPTKRCVHCGSKRASVAEKDKIAVKEIVAPPPSEILKQATSSLTKGTAWPKALNTRHMIKLLAVSMVLLIVLMSFVALMERTGSERSTKPQGKKEQRSSVKADDVRKVFQKGDWFASEDFNGLIRVVEEYQKHLLDQGLVSSISAHPPLALMDSLSQPARIDTRPDKADFMFSSSFMSVRKNERWVAGVEEFNVRFRFYEANGWVPTELKVRLKEGKQWIDIAEDSKLYEMLVRGVQGADRAYMVEAEDNAKSAALRQFVAEMSDKIADRAGEFSLKGVQHKLAVHYLVMCSDSGEDSDMEMVVWDLSISRASINSTLSRPRIACSLKWNGSSWRINTPSLLKEEALYGRGWATNLLK